MEVFPERLGLPRSPTLKKYKLHSKISTLNIKQMSRFFSFSKADRRVMLWMLVAGLLIVTLLVFCFMPDEKEKRPNIEQPEHWWEEKK